MRHIGKEFRGETLVLDGNSFERCTIEDCVLSYSGRTDISLVDCHIGHNEFAYDGPAANTIRTLQALVRSGPGGLDHVMRILAPNAPVDWQKVVELNKLPE